MSFSFKTPFGSPVAWAEVGLGTHPGSRPYNDDRCSWVVWQDYARQDAYRQGLLLLLLDGAASAGGSRASRLAHAAFLDYFFNAAGVEDPRERLERAVALTDAELSKLNQGAGNEPLQTTLIAQVIYPHGEWYAASIGDSAFLVIPPGKSQPAGYKRLGFFKDSAVGSGGQQTIEQVQQQQALQETRFALVTDGIGDNLPNEDLAKCCRKEHVAAAAQALAQATRARRIEERKRHKILNPEQNLGLDNMTAVVARYRGGFSDRDRRLAPVMYAGSLTCTGVANAGQAPDSAWSLVCEQTGSSEAFIGRLLRALTVFERTPLADRLIKAQDATGIAHQGAVEVATFGLDGHDALRLKGGGVLVS